MHNRINTRWSVEQVQDWATAQPWICGFNYLPSSAVNFADLWQKSHFDRPTIQRELGRARNIGFNALRINLSFLVWQVEGDDYLTRIDEFLSIASKQQLKVVLCPFDDCAFSGQAAIYGKQPEPRPGVHNSQAVGSPGREWVLDQNRWSLPEQYFKTVITRFAEDTRLLFWDLYNEPGNRMIFSRGEYSQADADLSQASLNLMEHCFRWAREIGTTQPLTVAAWDVPYPFTAAQQAYQTTIDRQALALSDIISFHGYCTAEQMAGLINQLMENDEALARPLFCTEWMARHIGSHIKDQLPLFKQKQVGAFNWGLVRGRTQTHLPWPFLTENGVSDKSCWFHDLLDENGEAYDVEEIALIGSLGTEPYPLKA